MGFVQVPSARLKINQYIPFGKLSGKETAASVNLPDHNLRPGSSTKTTSLFRSLAEKPLTHNVCLAGLGYTSIVSAKLGQKNRRCQESKTEKANTFNKDFFMVFLLKYVKRLFGLLYRMYFIMGKNKYPGEAYPRLTQFVKKLSQLPLYSPRIATKFRPVRDVNNRVHPNNH